jgi:hypothetical protein
MIQLVKIISTTIDSANRRLVKFFRFGKDDVQEVLNASASGDDSPPTENMRGIYVQTSQVGTPVLVGYINDKQIAKPGEKRIFATDQNGNVLLHFYMKDDGTIELGGTGNHAVKFNELEAQFNELNNKFNSFVNSYNVHFHASFGAVPAYLPPFLPPTISNANISLAKNNKIKTIQ